MTQWGVPYTCLNMSVTQDHDKLDSNLIYRNDHILKAYSTQWWSLRNEATIPPSDDSWTLILDPSIIRAKGQSKSTRIRNEMD